MKHSFTLLLLTVSLFLTFFFIPGCATEQFSSKDYDLLNPVISSLRGVYSVVDYGAVGDGKTLNTEAIQRAVDECANSGGGIVYIPPGDFVTGPIFLKSNINIHISQGATLLGSEDISDYPAVEGRSGGIEKKIYASLITGHNLENVSITGRGTLNGRGEVWWRADEITDSISDLKGMEGRSPDPNPPEAPLRWGRPRMINLYNCRNVLIRDVTILNSPSWTVHPVYCTNVTIENISIIQPYESPNTDGINPDSCDDVRIINCYVDVGDDCVTLKSGYNEYGRKIGIPCENIVITNCTMAHGRGGVVIGSEMSADVRNITISNCVFDGTLRGIRLKTTHGRGGVVENIRATNIVMRDVDIGFSMTMGWEGAVTEEKPVTVETPTFRDIHYSNITMDGVRSSATLFGLPEMPIQNVSFSDMQIKNADGGFRIRNVSDVYFDNISVDAENTPVIMAENVKNMEIERITDPNPSTDIPVLQFSDVKNVWIKDCTAYPGTQTFLEIKKGTVTGLQMDGNRIEEVEKEKEYVDKSGLYMQIPTAVQKTIVREYGKDIQESDIQRLGRVEGKLVYEVEIIIGNKALEIELTEDGEITDYQDWFED